MNEDFPIGGPYPYPQESPPTPRPDDSWLYFASAGEIRKAYGETGYSVQVSGLLSFFSNRFSAHTRND